MKVLIVRKFQLLRRCTVIGALLAGATTMMGASDKTTLESVKVMERSLGLTIAEPGALSSGIRRAEQNAGTYLGGPPAISPDGTAIAWLNGTIMAQLLKQVPYRGERFPLLTVDSLKDGKQQVWVEGRIATGSLGISGEGKVIVAMALPLDPTQSHRKELLAIDRRSGVVVNDLARFVTQFELGDNVEEINVSVPGTLVALGQREPEQMQVLEIPSGKSVYAGPGRFPRLSPDGKRLAFIEKDTLRIHSFVDGSTVQLLKGKRVKGVGGWSPDGRFLLAGAWTTLLAFEKRQIIIDTTTGEYAVIGKLGEGDYGAQYAWISLELVKQTRSQ